MCKMALPHWDLMRKKYRCRRRRHSSLNLKLKQKLDGFSPISSMSSRVAAKLTLPFSAIGTWPLCVLILVAWLTFTAPVGEAAPIYPRFDRVDEAVTSTLYSTAAEPKMAVLIRKNDHTQEMLISWISVENLVVAPITAAVMVVYLIAATCLGIRARSLKRDIMHVLGGSDAKTGRRPYIITMATGLIPGAGTRAEVLLRIKGSSANSQVVNISQVARSIKLANPARRAAQSSLVVWLTGDFGTPRTLQVKLHKSQKNSKWLLKSVTVTDVLAKVQQVACVNSWVKSKEPHEFELSLPENISRKSLLRVSFTRAFSRYYVWNFWSRSSSLSNQASLAICLFLVLTYMLGAALYITFIAKERPVPINQHSATVAKTVKEKLVETVMAVKPYLNTDHARDILCVTVAIAAVTWMLELLAYSIKKPDIKSLQKSKESKSTLTKFLADKGCATSVIRLRKDDNVAHVGSVYHKKGPAMSIARVGSMGHKTDTVINMRKIVQSRVQDLLHDTSVYVKYSQSEVEPHHSSLRTSDAGIWRKVSSLVQTPPRKFPRRTSTSHIDVTEKKYKCAACTVRKETQEEVSGSVTSAVSSTTNDILQMITENFPAVDASLGSLRKKIRDRISRMHAYLDISQNPVTEKVKLPVKVTCSEGKLPVNSDDNESLRRASSDITCNPKNSSEIRKRPSAVLSDFITKTVKVSVTSSAKSLMGLLMNDSLTEEDTKAKNKLRKVSSHLKNAPLSKENVKEALDASMSSLQGTTDTEMTRDAVTAAIKTASLAAADKILASLTDNLATAPSSSEGHKKLSTESQEKLREKVQMVLTEQQALVESVKDGLHAQIYAEQFCETLIANAIIHAKYLLTSEDDIATERLLNTCRDLVRERKGTLGKQLARKIKKAMEDGEVKKEMIAAAVQHMLVELDKLAGTKGKEEASCWCDAINWVSMLATEDKLGLMDAGTIVGVVADDLVRNHCPAACDHVIGMMTTLLADQEGIQRLARGPDAKGSNSAVNEVVPSPAQLMAKALLKSLQQGKDLDLGSSVSSGSLGGSNTSESSILEDQNQNQNCVVDMSTSISTSTTRSTSHLTLKTASSPTSPPMSNRDLLELEERLAAGHQGCLPSSCVVLLYALLGALMLTAVVTTLLYGAGLSYLQASLWLIYVLVAVIAHIMVLEPIKVFVILLLNKRVYL